MQVSRFTSRVNNFLFSHHCLHIDYLVLEIPLPTEPEQIISLSPLSEFFLWHCSAIVPQKPFILGFILCLKFSTVMEPHLGQSLCPRKEFQTIWTQQSWFALPHTWLKMLYIFVYLGRSFLLFVYWLTHLLLWFVVLWGLDIFELFMYFEY